ncbi:bifunctional precorrin-2 dehydrogenase/sirohydrochlorin ferrochelatase [Martiniozyma asiatica (nom. inval.)]|nr:bifunctional precorrin-2 dehydrogenase/sirohydrochlorin ferrochelatase [Martiniozyma asiatica]
MSTDNEEQVLPPLGGGSLMLAWQVRGKNVLVVGAGEVGLSRVDHLLVADAHITVISPEVHPTIKSYHNQGLLTLHERKYKHEDLTMYETDSTRENVKGASNEELLKFKNDQFAMVLTCLPDYELSLTIYYECLKLSLPVNLADRPKQCDFYFGSVLRNGPLQIMVSTNGKSPRLCAKVRRELLEPLVGDLEMDKAVGTLGDLRKWVREKCPGEDGVKLRMEWVKGVTDLFGVKEWGSVGGETMEKIKSFWPIVPKKKDI